MPQFARIKQEDDHHLEKVSLLKALVKQSDENKPEAELKALVSVGDETNSEIKGTGKKIVEAVNSTERAVKTLHEGNKDIVDAIKGIPEAKETNLSNVEKTASEIKNLLETKKEISFVGIEKLLTVISEKEQDLGELNEISSTLDTIKELLGKPVAEVKNNDYTAFLVDINSSLSSLDANNDENFKKLIKKIEKQYGFRTGGGGYERVYLKDIDGNPINPATEEKQDDVIDRLSDVQFPVPTDGDSVYVKDLIESGNDIGTFAGVDADVSGLFNDIATTIIDNSSIAIKWFEFKLNRPQTINGLALIAKTGDFSNVKIVYKDVQGNTLATDDDSSNSTKYVVKGYPVLERNICCVRVEFHTTDPVRVSFLRIPKNIHVISRIQAIKPDGTATEINATQGGNLKVAIEEFDDTFLDNPLPTTKGFNIPIYDDINITYILSGNGEGEIETVVYEYESATVATLTLSYDAGNNLINVIQS